MVFVGGSVDCMGRVDIMRYGAWPLSSQPAHHASDRCFMSCSLLFVVLWLALVLFFSCGKRRAVASEAVGGMSGLAGGSGGEGVKEGAGVVALPGVWYRLGWRGCGGGGVGGSSGVTGLAGMREWRGWRGCGREAFIGSTGSRKCTDRPVRLPTMSERQPKPQPTAVPSKLPHSNCPSTVPNRPLCRFGTVSQQMECGIFERTAV